MLEVYRIKHRALDVWGGHYPTHVLIPSEHVFKRDTDNGWKRGVRFFDGKEWQFVKEYCQYDTPDIVPVGDDEQNEILQDYSLAQETKGENINLKRGKKYLFVTDKQTGVVPFTMIK